MTLQNKRGNSFDTASRLIALLRVADIPARYGYGTVQIPIARVMNWVGGVTHPEAALQVLGQGGIPSVGIVQGGVITAVKLEHVWVEAWVDFEPSRGAVHRQGDTWVPLDAAFKQYQYTTGMDLQGNVPFDAQGFINQLTASAQVNTVEGWVSGLGHAFIHNTLLTYQDQVAAYITAQKLAATVGDVFGMKAIIPASRPVLALGLPYSVIVRGNVWSQLPETLRHKFRFQLYATALDRLLDTPVLHLTHRLPALTGKKITLSFVPASQADADLIAGYLPQPPTGGSSLDPSTLPTFLPGYLIHVVAELRVDGQTIARGGNFPMGQVLVSTAGLYDPRSGWQDTENTPPVAGEYRVLTINAAGMASGHGQALHEALAVTKARLEGGQYIGLTTDDIVGDLLFSTVVSYFALNDIAAQLGARVAEAVEYRRPSFGSFTAKVQPHFLFGIPRTVSFPGLELDITRLESIVVNRANDRVAQVAYVQQSGLRQSALEHVIPEQLFTDAQHAGEAVSAVKALTMASRQGQRIYTLTRDNIVQRLPQLTIDSEVKTEIEQAVATGKIAVVSQHDVTVGHWTGVGYVILDPETGAGMYQISGGANGAFLAGILFGLLIPFLLVFGFVATSPALIFILSAIAIPYLGLVDDSPYFAALREAIYADPACVWTGFSLGIGLGSLLVPELKIVAEAAKTIGRVLGITALLLPLIGPSKMYNEC